MTLPLPGIPLPPGLRNPGPALPLPPKHDPRADEGRITHVQRLAYNKARVRIGQNYVTLTRAQCFQLIGQLERVAGEI